MLDIRVPETITESTILTLIDSTIPQISVPEVRNYDFGGSNCFERARDQKHDRTSLLQQALYFKIIAAKGHRLHSRVDNRIDNLVEAGICWDKASKDASLLGYQIATYFCAKKAMDIYIEILNENPNHEQILDSIGYVQKRIRGLEVEFRRRRNSTREGFLGELSDHIWFPTQRSRAVAA